MNRTSGLRPNSMRWLLYVLTALLALRAAGKRETFYAVVLPSGSIVEPTTVRRSTATVVSLFTF